MPFMPTELEQRIRAVHPTGVVDEMDKTALLAGEYETILERFCEHVHKMTRFQYVWDGDWKSCRTYRIMFTMPAPYAPRKDIWDSAYDNRAQLKWIADHGENFSILYLKISRVWPAYKFFYNIWKPRGDTGYLDAEITEEPFNTEWNTFFNVAFPALESLGVIKLPEEQLQAFVRFMTYEDWCDDVDGCKYEEDFKPILRPANLGQCLFQDY